MNLSRAAKKFRDQMQEPDAPKRAKARKKAQAQPPAPAPAAPPPVVQVPAPAPEPVPPPAAEPTPKKVWPVKSKRQRFVREKVEKLERAAPPPLQLGSTKPAARLMTKNLALLPKDEPKPGRM
jgi:hypothetical protein